MATAEAILRVMANTLYREIHSAASRIVGARRHCIIAIGEPVAEQDMLNKTSRSGAIAFAGLLCMCAPASAQWLNPPSPGIPRTKDGKADLSAKAPRLPDGKPD